MNMDDEELYPCVGICMVDEDSGLCMGCGRPVQEPAAAARPSPAPAPPPEASKG